MKNFRKEIRKQLGNRLIAIVTVDEGKKFRLLYYFDNGGLKALEIVLPKNKPYIETITDIFPSAELYEREIHDFFGVEFKGNPRLHEKLFLPDDWHGHHPLRRETHA